MTDEVHSSSILLTFACWLLDFNLCLHFRTRLVYTLPAAAVRAYLQFIVPEYSSRYVFGVKSTLVSWVVRT